MGQIFTCCQNRAELIELEKLEEIDPSLVTHIQELRKQNKEDIAASREVRYPTRAIFRGLFDKDNKKCKYGELYLDKNAYFGHFDNDLPNGFGIMVKNQNEYFRGNFVNGKMHGKGKEESSNHRFEGQYENGFRKRGIFRTNQIEYTGEFKDNLFDGNGKLIYVSGSNYEGEFVGGKFEGKGILTHQNGDTYDGTFKNGQYDGHATIMFNNGQTRQKFYANGQIVNRKDSIDHGNPAKKTINSKKKSPVLKIEQPLSDEQQESWLKAQKSPAISRGNGILQFF